LSLCRSGGSISPERLSVLPGGDAAGGIATAAPSGDVRAGQAGWERHILSVLERTGWRVSGRRGAAEILGLKATTLESRMAKLGIKRHP
jgi:transcriptional regulator with GAF, ATPase, and Fis domain